MVTLINEEPFDEDWKSNNGLDWEPKDELMNADFETSTQQSNSPATGWKEKQNDIGCHHCGLDDQDILVVCTTCGFSFCNYPMSISNRRRGKEDLLETHLFLHIRLSGHSSLTLPYTSSYGHLELRCSFCFDTNSVQLGFVQSEKPVGFWRLVCSLCAETRQGNYGWAMTKWKSIFTDQTLTKRLVNSTTTKVLGFKNVSMQEISDIEFNDRYIEAKPFEDFTGELTPSKTPTDNRDKTQSKTSSIGKCPSKPRSVRIGMTYKEGLAQQGSGQISSATSNSSQQGNSTAREITTIRGSMPKDGVFENRWHYQNVYAPLVYDECITSWKSGLVDSLKDVELTWKTSEIVLVTVPNHIKNHLSYATLSQVSTSFIFCTGSIISLKVNDEPNCIAIQIFGSPNLQHIAACETNPVCKGKVAFSNIPSDLVNQVKALSGFARRHNPDINPYFYGLLLGNPKMGQRVIGNPFTSLEMNQHVEPLIQKLNEGQRRAIREALGHMATIICGPPGTGKTMVAASLAILLYWLAKQHNQGLPIIVVAPTNVAVKNVLQRCLSLDLHNTGISEPNMICVDAPEQSDNPDEKLTGYTLSSQMRSLAEKSDQGQTMEETPSLHEMYQWWDQGLWEKVNAKDFKRLKRKLARKILSKADIVFTTCASARNQYLGEVRFGTVIIDEATQASETQTFPLMIKSLNHLVLVGDEHQLRPTILNNEAANQGLAMSFYERIMCGIQPVTLVEQYRMPLDIMYWPSNQFYDGLLRMGGGVNPKLDLAVLGGPLGKHLCFSHVYGREIGVSGTMSYYNTAEALRVMDFVKALLESRNDLTGNDIGIITPYREQAAEIRRVLQRTSFSRVRECSDAIEIKTVDGFQGREKTVIILTLVRSNKNGIVGFLEDERRVNVALTRSKGLCVVIGNAETFANSDIWCSFLKYCYDNQVLFRGSKHDLFRILTNDQLVATLKTASSKSSRKPPKTQHKERLDWYSSEFMEKPSCTEEEVRQWERETEFEYNKVYESGFRHEDRFMELRPFDKFLSSPTTNTLNHRRSNNPTDAILAPFTLIPTFENAFRTSGSMILGEWNTDLNPSEVETLYNHAGNRAVVECVRLQLIGRNPGFKDTAKFSQDARFHLATWLFDDIPKPNPRGAPNCFCNKVSTLIDGNNFVCHHWTDRDQSPVCLFFISRATFTLLQDEGLRAKGYRPTPAFICSMSPESAKEALTLSCISNVVSNWTVSTFPFMLTCATCKGVSLCLGLANVIGDWNKPILRWMVFCPKWCGFGNVLVSVRVKVDMATLTPLDKDALWFRHKFMTKDKLLVDRVFG